jgi:cobyrinic acid a,c-diamide synthase
VSRGIAQAFHENLAVLCPSFQRALGLHSASELRIENERIELMAKGCRTMLEAQAAMLERSRQLAEKNRTPPPPPPPPNWEEIIAAAAPALAAMYTATIAAITKTAEVKVSGLAEPRAPEREKMSQSARGTR